MKKMKKLSKTSILVMLLLLLSAFAFGQENNKFYATIEDYKNNKPISGYELVSNSYIGYKIVESFKVSNAGEIKKMKLSQLPSELYTYDSQLCRTYDKACAIVVVEGPLCCYIYKGTRQHLWTSETISGKFVNDIDDLKYQGTKYRELLSKYNLLQNYNDDNPSRKFKDSPSSYATKLAERDIKYIQLLNEKILATQVVH